MNKEENTLAREAFECQHGYEAHERETDYYRFGLAIFLDGIAYALASKPAADAPKVGDESKPCYVVAGASIWPYGEKVWQRPIFTCATVDDAHLAKAELHRANQSPPAEEVRCNMEQQSGVTGTSAIAQLTNGEVRILPAPIPPAEEVKPTPELDAALARVTRLEEALAWYGDEKKHNWRVMTPERKELLIDAGNYARTVLGYSAPIAKLEAKPGVTLSEDVNYLIEKIDITLQYFSDEFPLNKNAWSDPVGLHAGGVSPDDLVTIRAHIQGMASENYAGAMADLHAVVAAYRKRMPDDEWLNLNYPQPPSAKE